MEDDLSKYPDRISDFIANKTILITGGTGFMGKVFVEKLLRVCHRLKKIYLIVRTKKDKDPKERIKEIFSGPLFNKLKEERGLEILNKVEIIAGDLMAPDLAISADDRQKLYNEVELIYHSAATIRFDEALKKAVLLNVRGTKLMLDLAKHCKKLQVFVHISTAYCHLNERILYEKPYPPPASPHHVIKTCEWMDEKVIDTITDKILGDIPNTYAFTKALGEALVVDEMDNLPVIILRPSIVVPIWKEPIPGWTDNINGPTGLLIGAGKGVIRTMYCKGDSYADYVPVDVAANGMILAAFDYITFNKVRRIYNITSSAEYKLSFEEIITLGRKIVADRMPLNGVAWYPGGSMKKSRFVHNVCFLLFHILPAIFVDLLLTILGYKPVLMRVQKRISKGFEVFEYYANQQWDFNNDGALTARDLLNPREKSLYKVDGIGLDYEDYFTDCVHAARLYILKEPDDTIPAARRHMKVMWFVDKLFKFVFVFSLIYWVTTKFLLPIFS